MLSYSTPDGSNLTLERQGPSDDNYATVGVVLDSSEGIHSLVLSGLAPNTPYSFRLRADQDGLVTYTAISTATAPPLGVPAAPTGFTASYNAATEKIDLNWSGDSTGVEQYSVLRYAGAYQMDELVVGGPSSIEAGVWGQYVIELRAYYYDANDDLVATPPAVTTVSYTLELSEPTDVQWALDGPAWDYETNWSVSWSGVAGASAYRVWDASGSIDGPTMLADVSGTSALIPIWATAGGGNLFSVQAIHKDVDDKVDAKSTLARLPAKTASAAPAAAAGLTAMLWVDGDSTEIRLLWDNVPFNEDSYILERSDDGGMMYAPVGTTDADVSHFMDSDVTWESNYRYRVKAVNSAGSSAYSNVATIDVVLPIHMESKVVLPGDLCSDVDDNFGGVVGDYTDVTFRVELYSIDSLGERLAARNVTSQLYTIDVGADGTIASVGDTLGASWTVDSSGSYATMELFAANSVQSFDITLSVSFSMPGIKDVTLAGEADHLGDVISYNASTLSKSSGRKITSPANPGPVVTPTAIYHINDVDAVGKAGHSAIIIPNGNGCTYYSYDMKGQVTAEAFNNIDDALASAKAAGYDREQHWNCTPQEATWAREKVAEWNGSSYQVSVHNCWKMVYEALLAAEKNPQDYGATPNKNFRLNAKENGGTASENSTQL